MLTPPEIVLVAIIAVLFVFIFATRLKTEFIAVLVLLMLSFSGLVTPEQALSGFSSAVVMTLLGLFIITRGLEETGVVHWISNRLNNIGQGSEVKLLVLFMLAGALLSLVMNNVAAGAVLLPAAVRVAQISEVSPAKLLMPLSFGTLVGGMATYLTTANIVMSELLITLDIKGLGMMDFIPTGSVIVLASLIYMLFIGRRLLPEPENLSRTMMETDLASAYQIEERAWEVRISKNSHIAYKALSESGIGEKLGLTVLAMWHGRHLIMPPQPDQRLYPSDTLLVVGRQERVEQLLAWGNELLGNGYAHALSEVPSIQPVEVIIAPRSNATGQTLAELKFGSQFGVVVLALWREGHSYRTDVGKMPLREGDALLVVGKPDLIETIADTRDYIVPISGYSAMVRRPHKALYALGIMAVVLLLAIFNLLPLPQVMLAGAAAMVLSGCLSMEEFYEAVEWRVIFLIAGMLPLSIAMADTGLADRIGGGIVDVLAGAHPLMLVLGMVVLTVLVVQIIGGQVTALLVGPIAINAALQMGLDPRAMSVAVAMACSMAFLTPISHPVNLLMMGPGGYQFKDFFKVGLGMTLVTLAALLLGLGLFWQLV